MAAADSDHEVFRFEPIREAVPAARRQVEAVLRRWACDELADDVAMVVTELVTNAVLHAGTQFEVTVERRSEGIRVGVIDGAVGLLPTPAVQLPPSWLAEDVEDEEQLLLDAEAMTGRGLLLVEAVALRWGVDAGVSTKTVWADIGPGDAAQRAPYLPANTLTAGEIPVRLVGVPARLVMTSASNLDDVVREFQVGQGDLGPLAVDLHTATSGSRDPVREATRHAVEAGRRLVDVRLSVSRNAPEALNRFLALLDDVAELERRGELLTLPPTDEIRRFRRWFVEEIGRQAAGEPPVACPFPVVASDDPDVVAAAEAAERLAMAGAAREHLAAIEADVAERLARTGDTEEVAAVVVQAAVDAIGARNGSLCRLRPDGETVEISAAVGYGADVVDHWGTWSIGDDVPASEVLRTGEPIFLRTEDELFARYPAFVGTPTVGDQAVAVVGLEEVAGVLVLGVAEAHSFDDAERDLLHALARLAGQALHRLG